MQAANQYMDGIMFPEGYRFNSDLNKFKKCVSIAKELMDGGQLKVIFGCVKSVNIELCIEEDRFNSLYSDLSYPDFEEILNNEIAIIIEQNISSLDFEEPDLKKYLEDKIDPDKIPEIIELKRLKRKYVQEQLVSSEYIKRYLFKERTLNEKLSDIRYEINKYVFDDKSDMAYAVVELNTSYRLEDDMFLDGINIERNNSFIRFVCDKQDLEYIIERLNSIKERL